MLEQLFLDSALLPPGLSGRARVAPLLAALLFTAVPVSCVLLLRRLSLPLPLSSHSCRCGRPLDCLKLCVGRCVGGDGVVHWSLQQLIWLASASKIKDFPFFHGAQLAIDTTLVSPLRADGEPHRRCAEVDGAALVAARRRKERTYPEWWGTVDVPSWSCSQGRSADVSLRKRTHLRPSPRQGEDSLHSRAVAYSCSPILGP